MDTRVFKPKNKESGTLTQTLLVAEVNTAYVSPVPENAPGVIVLRPGTVNEEHLYYKNRNVGAGTITGLTRDYTNLNGGVGFEHNNGSSWETMQAAEYIKNIVDALMEGYTQEQETIAYVSGTQFTVKTDKTSFYTKGRVLRFNQDNTKIATVASSSYSAGTDLTTVTVENGTVPTPLTHVEGGIFPKSGADLLALSKSVQNGSYSYAADSGGSDAYAITLAPVPTAYVAGMTIAFKANTANQGAATLNVNSLGAKTIKKFNDKDLSDGDIKAGSVVIVVYDGTNFQLQTTISPDGWVELTDGATIALDMGLGRKFRVTLGGNRTLTFSNEVLGKSIILQLNQDGTGSRLITWPTGDSTFATTDVNTTTEEITVGRDIPQGTPIKFASTGGVPAGLVAGTKYFAIRVSATVIKVASSIANAQAGTAIDLTSQGTGTHTLQAMIRWAGQFNAGAADPTLTTGKYSHDTFGIIVVGTGVYEGYTVGLDV